MCENAPRRRGPRVRPGVSIIELAIVMVLLGTIAVIAVPRFNLRQTRLEAAQNAVTMKLLGIQRLAVQEQHDVIVALDTTAARFRIHRDEDNDRVLDTGERADWFELGEGVSFGRSSVTARTMGGKAANFTETQSGMPSVTFHRSGAASAFGGFYMRPAGTDATTNVRAVEIERAFGKTSVWRWNGSAWVRSF